MREPSTLKSTEFVINLALNLTSELREIFSSAVHVNKHRSVVYSDYSSFKDIGSDLCCQRGHAIARIDLRYVNVT